MGCSANYTPPHECKWRLPHSLVFFYVLYRWLILGSASLAFLDSHNACSIGSTFPLVSCHVEVKAVKISNKSGKSFPQNSTLVMHLLKWWECSWNHSESQPPSHLQPFMGLFVSKVTGKMCPQCLCTKYRHSIDTMLLFLFDCYSLDRFRSSPVNDIFCQSLPGSPLKPHNLEQLEKQQEMLKMPLRRAKEVRILKLSGYTTNMECRLCLIICIHCPLKIWVQISSMTSCLVKRQAWMSH